MVLHPYRYAELLAEKIKKHNVNCWLVNTGWTGGPYGEGHRMPIKHTRALVNAALEGRLNDSTFEEDPIFGVQVPTSCEGVPAEILKPRNTWLDKGAYDEKAKHLAQLFIDNFRQFENEVPSELKEAGPKQMVRA